jgi:hypothetical protein
MPRINKPGYQKARIIFMDTIRTPSIGVGLDTLKYFICDSMELLPVWFIEKYGLGLSSLYNSEFSHAYTTRTKNEWIVIFNKECVKSKFFN